MAVQEYEIVDRTILPEELAEHEQLGLNERGRLVGIDEGVAHEIGKVSLQFIELGKKSGALKEKEVSNASISPEAQAIIDRLETRNSLLESQVSALEAEKSALEQKLTGFESQIKTLQDDVSKLQSRLDGSNKTLAQQLKEDFGNELYPHQRDAVKLKRNDNIEEGWTVISENPWKNDEGVWLVKVTNGETIQEVPVSDVQLLKNDKKTVTPAARSLYEPRETVWRRIRNNTPWAVEERDYYLDDRGPYYLENGEPVYVTQEEVEGRSVGGVAIVAAAIGGALAWELIGEKIFGIGDGSSHELKQIIHNQSLEINNLSGINHHLTEVNNHLSTQHHQEIRAIHGLHNEIARDHAQEMKDLNSLKRRLNESNTFTGYKFAIRYPWDWAANKVGVYRAESWLHTLSAKAAEHGHKIRWIFNGYEPNGSKREILQIDGTTNTQRVISVLNQYR